MIHPQLFPHMEGLLTWSRDKWNMSISMASTTRCHHGTITVPSRRDFCKWNMSISMASTTRCHHGTITVPSRLDFCSKKVATRHLKVPVRVLKVATRLLKRRVIPARPSYRFLILLDGPDHLAVSKSGRRRVWGRGCTSPLERRVASRAP